MTKQPHDLWGLDPRFVDAAGHGYQLQSSSPCIDAASLLTSTTSAGGGTVLPVADAMLFVDGFGIAAGDTVQLQGQSQTAKVTRVDYTANTLTLDRALTWTSGTGVSTPYVGNAPDLGAFEYGASGGGVPTNPSPPAAPSGLRIR